MDAETKERHRRELEAAESKESEIFPTTAGENRENGDRDGDDGADIDNVASDLKGVSLEDREKGKRDQKRAKAQRKREKQRQKASVLYALFRNDLILQSA